jgi:putative radical SAM-modified peptide
MENEESGVIVLDEGIEESAENTMACCTTAKNRIYVY